jgi:hypothetical protein
MLRPRTPGQATVALLCGLYLALLGLCLLLLAGLPRLPLEPIDSRHLAQARPALLILGLAALLAGAWLVPGAWLAVKRMAAPRPRYVSWRYGLRSGAAFAATWFVVDVLIAGGGPVHALLVGAVFLAAFPLLAGAAQLLWPRS